MKNLITLVQRYGNFSRRSKFLLGLLLKVIVFCFCFYAIWSEMEWRVSTVEFSYSDHFILILLAVFLLMFLNWGLEAYRWKISLLKEKMSFFESLRIILAGLTMNWIVPFTMGDLAVRSLYSNEKKEAFGAAWFNRIIMLFLTLLLGVFAAQVRLSFDLAILIYLISALFLALFLCLNIYKSQLDFSLQLGLRVLAISLFRYAVFTVQYLILLNAFFPSESMIKLLLGVGWIFMARTVIPSLFGSIGVREWSGMYFFEPFVDDLSLVILSGTVIWVINIVIPSIVGLYFIVQFKRKSAE